MYLGTDSEHGFEAPGWLLGVLLGWLKKVARILARIPARIFACISRTYFRAYFPRDRVICMVFAGQQKVKNLVAFWCHFWGVKREVLEGRIRATLNHPPGRQNPRVFPPPPGGGS